MVIKGLIFFCQISHWEGVVDLKGPSLHIFHFRHLERTDFGLLAEFDFVKSPIELKMIVCLCVCRLSYRP